MTPRTGIAAVAVAAVCVFVGWRMLVPNEERAVRQRLEALADDVNAAATGGAAAAIRTAEIGSYFTEDVVPGTWGRGSANRRAWHTGRYGGEAAAPHRLIPDAIRRCRRSAWAGSNSAHVSLTASFTGHDEGAPPSETPGDTMDAREFTVDMAKTGGVWRISHVGAVDTLR